MAQNHGSRTRPWANVPLPDGPWAPLLAVVAVIATVALVSNGPRIGGDAPPVPDGRAYAAAEAPPTDAIDRPPTDGDADDQRDDPPLAGHEPTADRPSTPRSRRRAPASSHRRRRAAGRSGSRGARPRIAGPSRRVGRSVSAVPADRAARPPAIAWRAEPVVRRPSTPHRAPVGSAEREFGP
jgi:hypothetical protein